MFVHHKIKKVLKNRKYGGFFITFFYLFSLIFLVLFKKIII